MYIRGIITIIIVATYTSVRCESQSCDRVCVGIPRTCHYDFTVEWYWTMGKVCADCPNNMTDCNRLGCVVTNGHQRAIMTVNRQIPGPTIAVCDGDTVEVTVENKLYDSAGISLHWHGQHVKDHQYMDGVGMLTQCDIMHEQSFTYRFPAGPTGTYWWHAHSGLQRSDGVAGPLIVRETVGEDIHHQLYDNDLTEHILFINDWTSDTAVSTITKLYWMQPTSVELPMNWALVNGRGFGPALQNQQTPHVVNVTPGERHRLRIINAATTCVFTLYIQQHTMKVISTDGNPIQPNEAGSLTILAGERYDIIVSANQVSSNYWLYVKGAGLECGGESPKSRRTSQLAVIRYAGAPNILPTSFLPNWDAMTPATPIFNPFPHREGPDVISVASARSAHVNDDEISGAPDTKLYIGAGTEHVHLPHNAPLEHATFFIGNETLLPVLNGITFQMPAAPPLSQPEHIDPNMICNDATRDSRCAEEELCVCLHMVSIPLGDLVEIVFIDENHITENHPMHLHGFSFSVIGMAIFSNISNQLPQPRDLTFLADVKEYDEKIGLPRNLLSPPRKDTISIPQKGYTIIRFRANNPGYWFMHCHNEIHSSGGMGMVLKVGEKSDLPPVPEDFPKCSDYNSSAIQIISKLLIIISLTITTLTFR